MGRRGSGYGLVWGSVRIVVGLLVLLWSLAPIYWGVLVALSSPADIGRSPASLLPPSISLGNFVRLLTHGSTADAFFSAFGNSITQAVGTTVLTLLIALPAAYAFARLRFAGSRTLLAVITITLAVPVYLVLIPLFQLATATGQISTHQGVILVLTSAALPLAVWILRSHIATLPEDIEAAARLDGAGTLRVLASVIAPLVAPGLVAAAVVIFLTSWGAFLIPLVFASTAETEPLTVLIPTFASKFSSDYGLQSAAGLIAVLPPVLLVLLLQKHLLSGLLKGATK